MDEAAWPFLIGRTRTEDHRIVVMPEFMTGPAAASALRSSVSGDPMAPGNAAVREIQALQGTDITVVYRVSIARAEAYGIPCHPGTGVLTDSHGRPILVTEGLVLRRAASDVMAAGLPQAAMDQAHALVAPAYQEFWSTERQFARHVGHAFPIAANNSPRVRLQYRPGAPSAAGGESVPAPADRPEPPAHVTRYRRRSRAVVSVLAMLALVAVGLIAFKIFSPRTALRDATQTMSTFCSDLRTGHLDAAYSLTTTSYQARTRQSAFASELLPKRAAVTRCEYVLHSSHGPATVAATLNVAQGKADGAWLVTLTGSAGASWQISAISHAPGPLGSGGSLPRSVA